MGEMNAASMKLVAKRQDLSLHVDLIEYWGGDPDAAVLCRLIDRAIDKCALSMSQYPKEFDPLHEDQLTVVLISQLDKFGIDVSKDATSGGHCDIVIKDTDGFLWLGEVKKVSGIDNNWIGSGFDQLVVRYSTGLKSQDRGSLIIFCNCDRIDDILRKWQEYLTKNYVDIGILEYNEDDLYFETNQAHPKTGRQYVVRHKPISVYFPPLHGTTTQKSV